MERVISEFGELVNQRDWEEFYAGLMRLRSSLEQVEARAYDTRLPGELRSRAIRKISKIYEIVYELERRFAAQAD